MDDRVLDSTLEQLEGDRLAPPAYQSRVVQESHRLRAIPLGELTVEDLRLLIGQDIGTRWLMPLALAVLEADPLADGDYYPGDLLSSVLSVDGAYW